MKIDIEHIKAIALHVGENIIMTGWGNVQRETKVDGTSVTEIDKRANESVITHLQDFYPEIPVISEEGSRVDNEKALASPWRFVVDPLDGTETFLKAEKNKDGFGVHIGFCFMGTPMAGVVYFPAQKRMYYTGNDGAAYLLEAGRPERRLIAPTIPESNALRVAVSWRSSKQPENINGRDYTRVKAVGGEMFCKVASGEADIAWRGNGRDSSENVFSSWDICAAQAILRAAGAELFNLRTGQPIVHKSPNFAIPACIGGHRQMLPAAGFTPREGRVSAPILTP